MERLKTEEEERVRKSDSSACKDVIFVKQLVSNACGTVALIHSIANNLERSVILCFLYMLDFSGIVNCYQFTHFSVLN